MASVTVTVLRPAVLCFQRRRNNQLVLSRRGGSLRFMSRTVQKEH